MMLTEKQAAETWCPHARIARAEKGTMDYDVIIASVNRDAIGSAREFVLNSCKCLASRCSQWRWHDPVVEFRNVDLRRERHDEPAPTTADFAAPAGDGWEPSGPAHQPAGAGLAWRQTFKRVDPERRGYCGLAGPPGAGEE
jgi:hypothetical protein